MIDRESRYFDVVAAGEVKKFRGSPEDQPGLLPSPNFQIPDFRSQPAWGEFDIDVAVRECDDSFPRPLTFFDIVAQIDFRGIQSEEE